MIEFNEREQEPGEEGDGGLSVAVVGIGGAGANVLDRIALEGMTEAELVCMNTDIRALTNSVAATKVQLGKNLTQGLGAGGDPDLGEDAAKSSEEDIRNAVRGKDIVFVCGGLGGGTGSGAAPFISGIARSEGAFVVAFTTMPFSFEGRRRLAQAQNSLNHLRKTANALITFDNDRMGSLVLPKQGIQEAFAEADKIISQSVRAVIQLVTKPGLISIGMDDLITALDNDDSRCLFGFGQATGENRAQEALSKALKSPLLDKGEMLEEAQNVLVHVCGGDSMTLFEVELLMKSLEKEVSEKAQILFGVGSDPKLGDKLSVTVISSMGKPLPPTADDDAPKAARSQSGDEQKEEASAETSKPEAPQSSRSEVKPDQSASVKAGVPVAAAATTLGASMLSAPAPAAESASFAPPRARMSPIRRAVQPVGFSSDEESMSEVKAVPGSGMGDTKSGSPEGKHTQDAREKPDSGTGKGVISIFEDDDDEGDDIFDDSSGDLDDDLDLMGDLGLDDEELDRLVAESAAVGLDDDDDTHPVSLVEDAELDSKLKEADPFEEQVETAPSLAEEISSQLAPEEIKEDLSDAEEDADIFDDDDLDGETVVAGAVSQPEVGAAAPVVEVAAKQPAEVEVEVAQEDNFEEDDFLVDGGADDFESFDDAEELEDDFDDDLEVAEESVEEEQLEETEDDFLSEEGEDDGDPLFGSESEAAPAPKPARAAERGASAAAPAQATKADELLKRVGLRRAGGALPGRGDVAASARPQVEAQEGGRSRFAWSKPGEVPSSGMPKTSPAPAPVEAVKEIEPEEEAAAEFRAEVHTGQLPQPRARVVEKTPPPVADEPAAESPFTPKGFVKRKPQAAAPARRGLPVKPTPLKLNSAQTPPLPDAQLEPEEEEIVQTEPAVEVKPEQQTFDSTLEPKHEKGRFEKGEPTVEDGEDLDLPTFLRRKKG